MAASEPVVPVTVAVPNGMPARPAMPAPMPFQAPVPLRNGTAGTIGVSALLPPRPLGGCASPLQGSPLPQLPAGSAGSPHHHGENHIERISCGHTRYSGEPHLAVELHMD